MVFSDMSCILDSPIFPTMADTDGHLGNISKALNKNEHAKFDGINF